MTTAEQLSALCRVLDPQGEVFEHAQRPGVLCILIPGHGGICPLDSHDDARALQDALVAKLGDAYFGDFAFACADRITALYDALPEWLKK